MIALMLPVYPLWATPKKKRQAMPRAYALSEVEGNKVKVER
jgi:hypothetical protein